MGFGAVGQEKSGSRHVKIGKKECCSVGIRQFKQSYLRSSSLLLQRLHEKFGCPELGNGTRSGKAQKVRYLQDVIMLVQRLA